MFNLQLSCSSYVWNCVDVYGFREQSSCYAVCSLHDPSHFTGITEHHRQTLSFNVWLGLIVLFIFFTTQQIATALLIHFGQGLRVSKRKDFSLATAKKLLPLSIFYNANVGFALASLKGVNIPMYIAIKRLTPLAVLVGGCIRGKGKPPTHVRACFLRSFWTCFCIKWLLQMYATLYLY
jgi:hypothetical protein